VLRFLPDITLINAALAVSFSIVVMRITKTHQPPFAATVLLVMIRPEKIKAIGFLYGLSPVLTGTTIQRLVARIFNNFTSNRRYATLKPFTFHFKK
jgi:CBS-domain-containing membrane protein